MKESVVQCRNIKDCKKKELLLFGDEEFLFYRRTTITTSEIIKSETHRNQEIEVIYIITFI